MSTSVFIQWFTKVVCNSGPVGNVAMQQSIIWELQTLASNTGAFTYVTLLFGKSQNDQITISNSHAHVPSLSKPLLQCYFLWKQGREACSLPSSVMSSPWSYPVSTWQPVVLSAKTTVWRALTG